MLGLRRSRRVNFKTTLGLRFVRFLKMSKIVIIQIIFKIYIFIWGRGIYMS